VKLVEEKGDLAGLCAAIVLIFAVLPAETSQQVLSFEHQTERIEIRRRIDLTIGPT
jgi:hypothetical protein